MSTQRKRLLDYATKLTWKKGVDYKLIEINEIAFKEGCKKFQEKDLSIVVFDKIDRYSRDSSSEEKAILTKLFRQGKIEPRFISYQR